MSVTGVPARCGPRRGSGAEAATAALRADNAGLTARVAELTGQMAGLQQSVTTLSGLLFGSSSEKGGSPSRRNGRERAGPPGGAGKRGQRPGGPGHGRRDQSHLETEERIIDVDAGARCCAECGEPFEFLGTEDSEQVDWQVKITRIVWRRRRYRRRCACPGPRTACAPAAPRPVPKGMFTAGFLARLAYEKHVLGRPVHRIVQALAADGFDVAAGTLCGALKQIAPLIAPWAEAIAAHGRTAGHVHADETSWQVFEDIEGKDGHRWWLWIFATDRDDRVRDGPLPQRRCRCRPAGHRPGADRAGGRHAGYISLDFTMPISRWPASTAWTRCGVSAISAGISCAPGPLTPRRSATGAMRGPSGSRCCTGRTTPSRPPPGTDAHEDAAGRWQRAFTDIDAHRILQASDAAKGLLHPAAAKVIATLSNEWDGLARHQDLPQLPLDNNTAEKSALRTPVIGRKNFYGSGAEWAAHLAADVWTGGDFWEREAVTGRRGWSNKILLLN